MKRIVPAISGAALLLYLLSCAGRHNGNIHIAVSESEDSYRITAEYNESRDRKVERYLERQFGKNGNSVSFINTRIDGDITLDDKTTFYIRKKPGLLTIKFDKDKNSRHSYFEIKEIGEGLKEVLKD